MRRGSLKRTLILYIVIACLAVFLGTAITGMYNIYRLTDREVDASMKRVIELTSHDFEYHLKGVEQSAEVVCDFILENANVEALKTNMIYREKFLMDLTKRCAVLAQANGEVFSFYFRMNKDIYGPTTGLFLIDDGNGDYTPVAKTDISQYPKDDREHVGWYYEPQEKGEAMWMEPYANRNINVFMISYLVPLYVNGEFLGVVGMDINMTQIHDIVDVIPFRDGFGFVVSDSGNLTYHKDYPGGLKNIMFGEELTMVKEYIKPENADGTTVRKYMWNGVPQYLIAETLHNGMVLAVSVPQKDFTNLAQESAMQMIFGLGVVIMVILFVIWNLQVDIVEPIETLTEKASRVAKGELGTEIQIRSRNEIGVLADSIRSMVKEMREYIDFIHKQAYHDAMTGVQNKGAYIEVTNELDRKIHEGMADFGVAVFDVNGLKAVNDNQGHEYGDMLIRDAAMALKLTFGEEKVYRVGGDEFVMIWEGAREDKMKEAMTRFSAELQEINSGEVTYGTPLTISKGYSLYDEKADESYHEVFQRADTEMYHDKELFYQGKNDRRQKTRRNEV